MCGSRRHFGVERGQPLGGHLSLGTADVGRGEQDLPLQVGELDHVVVDDADAADAGGGEVEEHRRAEPAGADDQRRAGAQRVLAPLADLFEDELAVVPLALLTAYPQASGSGRSAKSGVERYLSPVSHRMVTMTLPCIPSRRASSPAAQTLAPAEMPTRRPSSRARRARDLERLLAAHRHDLVVDRRRSGPWGRTRPRCPGCWCGPGWPPESTGESEGSTATTRTPGSRSLSTSPTPVSVPPVPTPATNTSTSPSVSSQISSAVVRRCDLGVGRVLELLRHERAVDLGRRAPRPGRSAPLMPSAPGVRTSSAP